MNADALRGLHHLGPGNLQQAAIDRMGDGFLLGAPGRAHLLGGESPLLARQGEELAERQGCRG